LLGSIQHTRLIRHTSDRRLGERVNRA
jgi:hypothetical protein